MTTRGLVLTTRIAGILVLLGALIASAGTTARAQDISSFLGKAIAHVEIAFEGGTEAGAEGEFRQVLEQQDVREGSHLSIESVHASIEKLLEIGLASRVSVGVASAPAPDKVIVTYRISRQVRVSAVRFDGVDTLAVEELLPRLNDLETGRILTQSALNRGADEVARYFQERGYFDAIISSETQLDDTGTRATVRYNVELGERTRVSTFEIVQTESQLPALVDKLLLKPGAAFSQEALDADESTIRKEFLAAGYLAPEISEAEIQRNLAANTVALAVRVASGPLVEVAVEGVDYKEKTLRTILPVYTEGGIDDYQLAEGDRRLAEQLQRDGYFFARIQHSVVDGATPNSRRVTYSVTPGRRFKVVGVDIEGTSAISYTQVQPELNTQVAGFIFLSRGLTSRDLLARDSDILERRMRSIGYRKAVVRERRLGVSPDSDDLTITFVIEEGPRSRVESVGMRGNKIYSRKELLPDAAVKESEFYSDANIGKDANEILRKYSIDGFISAEVVPEIIELDPERVRIVFNIQEGLKAYIDRITVVGNVRTKDKSVREYIEFKEGTVLRLDELRRTERNLYDTGVFRTVVIRTESLGPSEDGLSEKRSVFVDLEETKPWLLVYGGGYNSDDGARGILEISNVNLFGRLNTGAIRLRASPREQLGRISYTNPVPFGYDLPLLTSLTYQREKKDAFGVQRFSILIQEQKKLSETSALFFRYNFQQIRLFDLAVSQQQLVREDRPVRLGRLSIAYLRDTRNSPFDPDAGSFLSLDAGIAAKSLGGSEQFTRFFGEYQRYDKLPKVSSLVYAGGVQIGLSDPYGDARRLPISERFFSGGARTLRGFRFEQAGPRDKVTNNPIGGNLLVVLKNELRFPVYSRLGGAVFSDTGNVYRKISDFDFNGLTQTIGAGLRLDTPVGPVRIDFGYLLNRPDGVPSSAVHVSFGQSF